MKIFNIIYLKFMEVYYYSLIFKYLYYDFGNDKFFFDEGMIRSLDDNYFVVLKDV